MKKVNVAVMMELWIHETEDDVQEVQKALIEVNEQLVAVELESEPSIFINNLSYSDILEPLNDDE